MKNPNLPQTEKLLKKIDKSLSIVFGDFLKDIDSLSDAERKDILDMQKTLMINLLTPFLAIIEMEGIKVNARDDSETSSTDDSDESDENDQNNPNLN